MAVRRRGAALVGLLLFAALTAYSMGQQARSAEDDKGKSKSDETIDTRRYAKAQLRLAELTLERALEFNRKMPRTLSSAVIDHFKGDVAFAKLQLERVSGAGQIDAYQDLIARAELDLRAAKEKLKAGQHENQIAKGTLNQLDMERLKLSIDVAQFQLDRGKALAAASPAEKLQWQLEMLSASLNKLRMQVMIISQNRLSEF